MKGMRYLTEGALMLAIYMCMLLISLYIPVIRIIVMLLLPLPFIFYTMRHHWKKSLLLLVASLLLTVLLSPLSLPVTFMAGTGGITLGYFYRKKGSGYAALVNGTVVYCLNLVLFFIVAKSLFHVDFQALMDKSLDQSINQSQQFIGQIGQGQIRSEEEKQINMLKDQLNDMKYLIPSIMVLVGMFLTFINHVVARPILKRLKHDVPRMGPFSEFQLPRIILWFYLISILLSFIQFPDGSFMFMAINNVAFLLQILILLQGFAVIFSFFKQKKMPIFIPIVLMFFSFFIPLLLQIVRILGIIDLGFNLRRRHSPK